MADVRLPESHHAHGSTAREALVRILGESHAEHTAMFKAARASGHGLVIKCNCGALGTAVLAEDVAALRLVPDVPT